VGREVRLELVLRPDGRIDVFLIGSNGQWFRLQCDPEEPNRGLLPREALILISSQPGLLAVMRDGVAEALEFPPI
jgi:hypothetical protein